MDQWHWGWDTASKCIAAATHGQQRPGRRQLLHVLRLCPCSGLWDELSVVELRSLLRSYPIDRTSLPAPIELLRRSELIEALNQIQAMGN